MEKSTMIYVLPNDRTVAAKLEGDDRIFRPEDFRAVSDGARAYDLRRVFAAMKSRVRAVYVSCPRSFNHGEVLSLHRAVSFAAGAVGLDVYESTSGDFTGPYRLMIHGGKILE